MLGCRQLVFGIHDDTGTLMTGATDAVVYSGLSGSDVGERRDCITVGGLGLGTVLLFLSSPISLPPYFILVPCSFVFVHSYLSHRYSSALGSTF